MSQESHSAPESLENSQGVTGLQSTLETEAVGFGWQGNRRETFMGKKIRQGGEQCCFFLCMWSHHQKVAPTLRKKVLSYIEILPGGALPDLPGS